MEEDIIRHYPNGLRTVVHRLPGAKTVSSQVTFDVGSTNERSPDRYGISHLLEHCMFSTNKRSDAEIQRLAKFHGLQLNACTDLNFTAYMADSTPQKVEVANEILSDMVFDTDINERMLNKEKKIIYQEIKDTECEAAGDAEYLCHQAFYSGTPYEHDGLGTAESVKGITLDELKKYKKQHYTTSDMIVTFAGNITPEKADKLVEDLWLREGLLEKRKKQAAPVKFAPSPTVAVGKNKAMEIYRACIAIPTCGYGTGKNNMQISLLSEIIDEKLFVSIREDKNIAYEVSAGIATSRIGGYIEVSFSTSPENVEQCFEIIGKELAALRGGAISKDDLTAAQNSIDMEVHQFYEDAAHINLSNSRSLAITGEIVSMKETINRLRSFKFNDIIETAREYATPRLSTVALIGARPQTLDPHEYLGNA